MPWAAGYFCRPCSPALVAQLSAFTVTMAALDEKEQALANFRLKLLEQRELESK